MKACAHCGRLYPDDAGFCPVDGSQLGSATQVPVASDASDPRIGQLVAQRYQVRRVVADGGMGRVYEALDMVERRNVALKILHPDVVREPVAVERFKREFAVSEQLPHDHIVEVLGFVPTSDGSHALVMEFLYGEELRATLKREGVISPARLIRMLSQVAVGLDEAHHRNFVHRDLKPDNIFLCQTPEGDTVKILDFGSVKDKTDGAKKLTQLGTTIGSPFYMAPEQAQGLETLDQRADVWALAAIAYECATGVVPFTGTTGPSILLEILTKEAKPPSLAAKGKKYPVPPTLDRVMLHAFKKQPGSRIGSVGALADSIGDAYGLKGKHLEWANTAERELGKQIEAKLPELMRAGDGAPARGNVADAFFGETGALDSLGQLAVDAPAAAPIAKAVAAPMSAHSGIPTASMATNEVGTRTVDDLAAAGLPRGSRFPVLIAVGGGALVLGLVVVIVIALLR